MKKHSFIMGVLPLFVVIVLLYFFNGMIPEGETNTLLTVINIALPFIAIMLSFILWNPLFPVFFCDKLGWHLEPIEIGYDGCSRNGTCPRCGKHVMQDSQKNWF